MLIYKIEIEEYEPSFYGTEIAEWFGDYVRETELIADEDYPF